MDIIFLLLVYLYHLLHPFPIALYGSYFLLQESMISFTIHFRSLFTLTFDKRIQFCIVLIGDSIATLTTETPNSYFK